MDMVFGYLISAHTYGVINGLFIASFIYTLFLALSHLVFSNEKRVGRTFLALAVGYAAFGLFNVFYQQVNSSIIVHVLPTYLTDISKYGAPVALAIFSFVFFRVVALHSYRAYELYERYYPAFSSLLVLDAVCITALFFTSDLKISLIMILVMSLPHLVVVTLFSFKGLKTPAARTISLLFCFLFVLAMLLTLSIYDGNTLLTKKANLYMHVLFSIMILVISFLTIRYSMKEAQRFFAVRELDTDNLIDDLFKAPSNQELFMLYQPKVALKTGKVCGAEALIRWQHPKHGIVSPSKFIPLAEKTGMIAHLCRWMIKVNISQQRQFIDAGLDIPISINFSVKNLRPSMVTFLLENLAKEGVPHDKVVLEITESLFLDFNERVSQALKMLQDAQIKLSLDDYGTGFSSLNYLQRTSPSELKIDRSFITDIQTNMGNQSIVRSVIQMSNELNISVVAEGVETAEVMSFLTSLGCDVVQGYVIAKPMSANVLVEWLADEGEKYIS